jgi:hypothetical protein
MQQNELLQWLAEWTERTKPHSNLIFLIVLLVVVGAGAMVWWTQQSSAATSLAWEAFYRALSTGNVAELEDIVARNPGTDVGRWAAVLAGDVYLSNGTQQLFRNKSAASDALRKAVNHYMAVRNTAPSWWGSVDLLRRRFAAMTGLARLAVLAVVLLVLVGVCALPFALGVYIGRKRGTPESGWKIGLIPFGLLLLAMIAACVALPQILQAMGIDTTPPQVAMRHQRATFGLARAYEALAGTRQSQGELDKATEVYQELLQEWPDGPYGQLAAERLEDLNRRETRALYDKFAEFDPRPALPDVPGLPGTRPRFDLDSLSEDGIPGLPESLMPGDATKPSAPTEEGVLFPTEGDAGVPAESDAAAAEEGRPGLDLMLPQVPGEPDEASGPAQAEPEATPDVTPAPVEQSSDQEPGAADEDAAAAPAVGDGSNGTK